MRSAVRDLTVCVVRARPSGVRVLGELIIQNFREQAAGDWGAAYTRFLKKLGSSHLAATVLLPREELTVRQVALPGVSDKDLDAAIRFEIDSLNPYAEEDVASDFSRIGPTASVLIGLTRLATLERYTALFSQAGIKVASFTFSAAAVYAALRLNSTPAGDGFVAMEAADGEVELYGESPTKPLLSARVDQPAEQARAFAIAELRMPPETEPAALHDVLARPLTAPADYDPARSCLAYATALSTACLRPALKVNLLPADQRRQTSRLRYVPTAVLATLVLLVFGAVIAYPRYADRQYIDQLHAKIQELEPLARKAAALNQQINITRNRAQTLDNFRLHTKDDLDALAELTRLLPAPAWVNSFQLTRSSLAISGEAEQAAPLIKLMDGSRQFRRLVLRHSNRKEPWRSRGIQPARCTPGDCAMTLQSRDKRALVLLGAASVLMLLYWISGSTPVVNSPKAIASTDTVDHAERRLDFLRRQVSTLNGKQRLLKQASTELADREQGLIAGDTAEQAQAQLLEILKRIANDQTPPLELRQVELAQPQPYGDAYGMVSVAVNMDCHIEELVNFLASIASQREIMSTDDVRFGLSRPKEKTMPVRITVTGLVARRLIPVKKGLPQL